MINKGRIGPKTDCEEVGEQLRILEKEVSHPDCTPFRRIQVAELLKQINNKNSDLIRTQTKNGKESSIH